MAKLENESTVSLIASCDKQQAPLQGMHFVLNFTQTWDVNFPSYWTSNTLMT